MTDIFERSVESITEKLRLDECGEHRNGEVRTIGFIDVIPHPYGPQNPDGSHKYTSWFGSAVLVGYDKELGMIRFQHFAWNDLFAFWDSTERGYSVNTESIAVAHDLVFPDERSFVDDGSL